MLVGVDVGGTFTDLAAWDGTKLTTAKVSTTSDPSEGVSDAVAELGGAAGHLIHGTTVATNALLERKGARVVLITSTGLGDVLEIGRQDRPSLYDPMADRPQPLVARSDRVETARRGEPGAPQPADDVAELTDRIVRLDPEAVAVSLLYSFADPAVEASIAAALATRLRGLPVSLSSQVAPEFREYERTSTTVLNAYLSTVVPAYLEGIAERLAASGVGELGVMRSSGGIISAQRAAQLPAAILLSGPAGGAVAAASLGVAMGYDEVISFDMGGTSTDVSRVERGRPEISYERPIDGFPCRLPAVAVHTVGAGGGSIGWIDPGGALRVGPQSSGAHPGPAAYARGGTSPTVTDANLLLGRLDVGTQLAGGLTLEHDPAATAMDTLSHDPTRAALGVVAVVEENMARAIRAVSVEQGTDPRRAMLVAFGGAGAMHATAMAKVLSMAGVIVPPHAGVFSALGMLLAPGRADAARSVTPGEGLQDAIAQVRRVAQRELLATTGRQPHHITSFVDARYLGQSHETVVPFDPGDDLDLVARRFHEAHFSRNGFARTDDPVEFVTVRAEAIRDPELGWSDLPVPRPTGEAERGHRGVVTSNGTAQASVWWRPGLAPGREIAGPAVIEEPEATTYLDHGERALVTDSGALEVAW